MGRTTLLLVCAVFSVCIISTSSSPTPPEEEASSSTEGPCDNNQPGDSFREEMTLLINTLREDYSLQLSRQQALIEMMEEQLSDQSHANSVIEDLRQQISDLTSSQQTLQQNLQQTLQSSNAVMRAQIGYLTSHIESCGCGSGPTPPVVVETTTTEAPVLNENCRPERHIVINGIHRLTSNGKGQLCDRHMEPAWYRFMVEGDRAVIPTSCVMKNSCGTSGALWLDLQGQTMPAVGEEVPARACESWGDSCCLSNAPVTVVNCSTFYVYHLRFPNTQCDVAYCVERQGL